VKTQHSAWRIYSRLLGQARSYWPHIALLGLLNLLAMPIALLSPVPLKLAVDCVIGEAPLPGPLRVFSSAPSVTIALLVACGLVVIIAALRSAQSMGTWLYREYVGERLLLDWRARLFGHVQRLSFAYHDEHGTHKSTYVIQYDAPSIQWLVLDGLIPMFTAAITLAAMIVITAAISVQLAVVALAVCPLVLLMTDGHARRLRSRWHTVKQVESEALGVVQEVLGALRIVKAFGGEEAEQDRFFDRSQRGLRERLRVVRFESLYSTLIGVTLAIGTAIVLGLGAGAVRAETMSIGDLLLVMAYLAQMYGPLKSLGRQVASQQSKLAGAERALALLDESPSVVEKPNAKAIRRAAGAFTLRDVSFEYLKGQPVLRAIDLEIPAGRRVGLAGRTGAGKSTLVSLLMRFYDPTRGSIAIDGHDLRDLKIDDLRRQFSIVPQDPVLFSTSIIDNIRYARPDATEAQVHAAAEAANIHDFVVELPEGYETRVGERGMRLSGGERQRVALARAFLRDAPVLILDEPTSSIDVKTEATIIEAMDRLMAGRTVIMIAHRLGTLAGCDLQLELSEGRLVEPTMIHHTQPVGAS